MERMLGEACNGVKKKTHKYSRTFSESESWGKEFFKPATSTSVEIFHHNRSNNERPIHIWSTTSILVKKKSLLFFSLFVFDRDINAVMIRISLISLIFIASLSFVLYLVSIEALTIHDPDTQVISSIRAAMFLRLTYDQESKMADPACVSSRCNSFTKDWDFQQNWDFQK